MRHRSDPGTAGLQHRRIGGTLSGQYSLTVSKDRLLNSDNEPQNWLLMNGDYGSQRYSQLTQINRDNVKDLRMVWAMALGGMQDVGQNGPESEDEPAHRQRLHVHERWLGDDLQDRRPSAEPRASSRGWPTRACSTKATRRARAASRCGKTRSSPTCLTDA